MISYLIIQAIITLVFLLSRQKKVNISAVMISILFPCKKDFIFRPQMNRYLLGKVARFICILDQQAYIVSTTVYLICSIILVQNINKICKLVTDSCGMKGNSLHKSIVPQKEQKGKEILYKMIDFHKIVTLHKKLMHHHLVIINFAFGNFYIILTRIRDWGIHDIA